MNVVGLTAAETKYVIVAAVSEEHCDRIKKIRIILAYWYLTGVLYCFNKFDYFFFHFFSY
jgi:hypothetical protein